MIKRLQLAEVLRWLNQFPAVGILGPRQCGKSTLARQILIARSDSVYLDLERPADAAKLRDPEAFFALHPDKLVCLDEIQRRPELFPILRGILDERGRNGQLLVLGSASPEMLKQSSETLAGRIGYRELTPFLLPELAERKSGSGILRRHWLRGGFPRSYLAESDAASHEWREEFIRTFLERDLPQLGVTIPAATLGRFWQMCAHSHGQLWNASKLAQSLGVTHPTTAAYLRLLEKAFILRVLPPWESNLKKRLVKTPKVYLRDSGLLHALLRIDSSEELLGHPVYGSSWEGYVIEQILGLAGPGWAPFFYRTSAGAECDLILRRGRHVLAIECKASSSPKPSLGFWRSIEALEPEQAWIVAPVPEAYPIERGVRVLPLPAALDELDCGFRANRNTEKADKNVHVPNQ